MKRVLCPKCENYLYFDETKYSEGQSLVFVCEHCGKQFSIRLGKSKVKALRKEENLEEEAEVVILKIVEEDGEELLASVDDEEENLRLYNLFMSRLEALYDAPEDDEE